jgi:DNA segregation ATPase FtsK/SpoIIIE-like protein
MNDDANNEYYDDDDEFEYYDDDEEYFDADEGRSVRNAPSAGRVNPFSGLGGSSNDADGADDDDDPTGPAAFRRSNTGGSRFGVRPSGASESSNFDREQLRARFGGGASSSSDTSSGSPSRNSRLDEIRSGGGASAFRRTGAADANDEQADDADDAPPASPGAFRRGSGASSSPFSFGSRPAGGSSAFSRSSAADDDDDDEYDEDADEADAAAARRERYGSRNPFAGLSGSGATSSSSSAAPSGRSSPSPYGSSSAASSSSTRSPFSPSRPAARPTSRDDDAKDDAKPTSGTTGNRPGGGFRFGASGGNSDAKPAAQRPSASSASSSSTRPARPFNAGSVRPEPLEKPEDKKADADTGKDQDAAKKPGRFGGLGLGRGNKDKDAKATDDAKQPATQNAKPQSQDDDEKKSGPGRFGAGLGAFGRGNKDKDSTADDKAQGKKPGDNGAEQDKAKSGPLAGGLGRFGRGNKDKDSAVDDKQPAAPATKAAGQDEKKASPSPFGNLGKRGNQPTNAEANKGDEKKPRFGAPGFGKKASADTTKDKGADKRADGEKTGGFGNVVGGAAAGAVGGMFRRGNKNKDQADDAASGAKTPAARTDDAKTEKQRSGAFGALRRGKQDENTDDAGAFANAQGEKKQSARGQQGKQAGPKKTVGERVAGLFQGGPMDDDGSISRPPPGSKKSSSKTSKGSSKASSKSSSKGSKAAAAAASKVPQVESEGLTLDNWLDIAGVGLVFGSLVYFFSAISSEQAAISAIHNIFGELLGWGAIAVPIGMFVAGMWLIVRHFGDQAPSVDPLRIVGLGVGFVALLIILQYIDTFNYSEVTNVELLRLRLEYAWQEGQTGGGFVGARLYWFLFNTMTEVGGFFVVVLALIFSWMLIARRSMSDMIRSLISVWRSTRDDVRKRADARRAERTLTAQRTTNEADATEIQIRKPQAQAAAQAEPEAAGIRINAGGQTVDTGKEQQSQQQPQPAYPPGYGYGPAAYAYPQGYPMYPPGYGPPPQQQDNKNKGLLGGLRRRNKKQDQPQMPPMYYPPYMPPPGYDPHQYGGQMPPGYGPYPGYGQQSPNRPVEGQQPAQPQMPQGLPNVPQPPQPETQRPAATEHQSEQHAQPETSLGDLLGQGQADAQQHEQPAASHQTQEAPQADAEPDAAQAEYERLQRLRRGEEGFFSRQQQAQAAPQPTQNNQGNGNYNPFGRPAGIPTHSSENLPYSDRHGNGITTGDHDDGRPSQLPSAQPTGRAQPYQEALSIEPQQQPRKSDVVNQTKAKRQPQWKVPDYTTLLSTGAEQEFDREHLLKQARIIEDTLAGFSAPGRVVEVNTGPVVTQFGVEPDYINARGGKKQRVKVSAIAALDRDLQLALGARSIRVEAPVPGKGYVGVEVPNEEQSVVRLRDVMEDDSFKKVKSPLGIALGQSVSGKPLAADLSSMPHLLIAGTTGSGKSVCVNSIIISILTKNSPEQVRFIMVDPKRVELTGYNGIPHLVAPVVVELERIVGVLKWVTREMDERYKKFSQAGARNIVDFNKHLDPGSDAMPYIVVIIDELADLMMLAPEETERTITRIAALARATGIHLVIATQRPSVDVVTGTIKANFPARIAFAVAGGVDSRVILDQPGAERLLGKGDMLYLSGDAPAPQRLQGVFVSDMEIDNVVGYWKMQALDAQTGTNISTLTQPVIEPVKLKRGNGNSDDASAFDDSARQQSLWNGGADAGDSLDLGDGASAGDHEQEDELYDEAVELVRRLQKASVSLLQRRLRIGYTRAARLIDMMEARGVVGKAKEGSSKPRDVIPES